MRLRESQRRHADLALERAPQVALAHAQLTRELGDAAIVQRARGDPLGGYLGEARHRAQRWSTCPRRQLGTAAQAGPKARALGGRRGIEEAAVTVVRQARRANRSAIDARRRDPDEKDAVETRVPRVHRELIGLAVDEGSGKGRSGGHHNERRYPVAAAVARRIRTLNSKSDSESR